jgi:hypothetical protein
MATVNSNSLCVYALSAPQTSPIDVFIGTDATAITGVTPSAGDFAIVAKDTGEWVDIFTYADNAWGSAASQLDLLTYATQTSLEASNTINEVAARNACGSSANYIASGSLSWSLSVDGLLDVSVVETVADGSGITLMSAAQNQYYLIAKFAAGPNISYYGQCLIGSISFSGGVDEIATYSSTLNGYGPLYND